MSVVIFLGINSTAAVVLTTIVIPGHLMFTTVIHFISGINETFSPMFLTFYLGAALIQVSVQITTFIIDGVNQYYF